MQTNTRRGFLAALLAVPCAAITALKGKPKHRSIGGLTLQEMDRVLDAPMSFDAAAHVDWFNPDMFYYCTNNYTNTIVNSDFSACPLDTPPPGCGLTNAYNCLLNNTCGASTLTPIGAFAAGFNANWTSLLSGHQTITGNVTIH
jgi:hypothetical protein